MQHLNLRGINWIIVGGESGPGARPIQEEWIKDIRDQCLCAAPTRRATPTRCAAPTRSARVPFFFKQ
ncbi:MAG: DUF5131 family protein, partial [Anaerolineales bacterium]|nr:DUF5131 family protein [Anaerolineales bacterium]